MFNKIHKGQYWDKSITLVEGCSEVSAGCAHCWSRALHNRFKKNKDFADVQENMMKLLHIKSKKQTVFTIWNDLFHEKVNNDAIHYALTIMGKLTDHIFIVLTKRADRALVICKKWCEINSQEGEKVKLPKNIWIGVTVENEENLYRTTILKFIPAAVRFISFEPLLSSIRYDFRGIHWVIAGCESGPGRRPAKTEWFRELKSQCVSDNVPFFLKQMEINGKVTKAPMLEGRQWLYIPIDKVIS